MRAAVYKGNQKLVVEEVPTPAPGPGQVVVKVNYCAICGTDVHAFLSTMAIWLIGQLGAKEESPPRDERCAFSPSRYCSRRTPWDATR